MKVFGELKKRGLDLKQREGDEEELKSWGMVYESVRVEGAAEEAIDVVLCFV